jgi:hypothetical protein
VSIEKVTGVPSQISLRTLWLPVYHTPLAMAEGNGQEIKEQFSKKRRVSETQASYLENPTGTTTTAKANAPKI